MDNYLTSLFLEPGEQGSFSGVDKLLDVVKAQGRYTITRKQIYGWLAKQSTYSQNRTIKPVKERNRVVVKGIDDQYDADLIVFADKTAWTQPNDGYRYVLVVIDIFTRYVWARALKNKEARTVRDAFDDIFDSSGRLPRRIRSDRGSEFTNAELRRYMNRRGITHFFTNNELQANYVERVIKTLKSKLMRYLTDRNTNRWVDVIQEIVDSYNNTFHYGIRATPAFIDASQEKRLWWQQYIPREKYDPQKRYQMRRRVQFAFKVGDMVRVNKVKKAFQREYGQKWTGEVFKIQRRFGLMRLPKYKLVDWANDPIDGTFYQNELQRVIVPPNTLFMVESILDRKIERGVSWVYVHYAFWPKKFDEWIREDSLEDV